MKNPDIPRELYDDEYRAVVQKCIALELENSKLTDEFHACEIANDYVVHDLREEIKELKNKVIRLDKQCALYFEAIQEYEKVIDAAPERYGEMLDND